MQTWREPCCAREKTIAERINVPPPKVRDAASIAETRPPAVGSSYAERHANWGSEPPLRNMFKIDRCKSERVNTPKSTIG